MGLSSISINRPVLAIVMSFTILLFGAIGFSFLGVREYPSVDPPIITVSTNYTGANADIIETQVTEPLEESINGIAGIRTLTSVSRDGRSTITVEFDVDMDLENAANDVRDRVSRAERQLPQDIDKSIVTKASADDSPIVMATIRSKERPLLEVSETADKVFKEQLQTIPGVSEVRIWGEKKYSMRLWLDPVKLAAYRLTPLDVNNALAKENIELPSGSVEGTSTELSIRTLGRLQDVEQFNNMIIKEENGSIIRLRDVGKAELYPENARTIMKCDGVEMVGVALIPQPGANYIDIADEFYKRLDQIKKELPPDIETNISFDQTVFIRNSISEVEETIFIAFGLVIIIIFLFLRNWRSTFIPVLVIPISIVGAFFIMYAMGFSINVLTLLGLVLAIGLVVDDAIVVLENIYRKIEEGMRPIDAGHEGTKEIFFAIIATTVSLAAVFLPIMFLEGVTGRLFKEFGVVIAGAVIISAFVALTLTPMLSARLLKHEGESRFYRMTEPFFVGLTNKYKSSLDFVLNNRWVAFIVIAVSLAGIYFIGGSLQSELAPIEDRSQIRINSTAPEGTAFRFMEDYMNKLDKLIGDSIPEKRLLITISSPVFGASSSINSGSVRLMLTDPDERLRTQTQIAGRVTGLVSRLSDARNFIIEEQSIGTSRGGLPVQYVIQATGMDKLRDAIPKFLQKARQDQTFAMVDANLKFNKPELVIEINRDKARDLGVSISDVAQTLQFALSEQRFGYFTMKGKQYQVIGQVMNSSRSKPQDIGLLYVRNNRNELVQLDNLVQISGRSSPPQLFRFNRFSSATISASLAPGKTIGDGIAAMDRIAAETLDQSFYTDLSGPSKDFAESSSTLLFTFGLALILIYLVLAAQFESFSGPLIIMFTVPLALAGALFSLWYFNQTMNIFSEIGMIMLIGIVTKNGILIVEFANQQKQSGLSNREAVAVAAAIRMRPILMTSFTTVLGTLPIALALGAGSGGRQSMGIAVVGGLIFSTILTLYVIPVIYTFLSGNKTKNAGKAVDDAGVDNIEVKH